jgi:uncharacterized protein YbjT (DUF2867 family)
MSRDDMTLVVGGTGKTGRRVVERLQQFGLPYRIGSRSARPVFDCEDRRTWVPSFKGVRQAYVTYYPDPWVAGRWKMYNYFSLMR